MNLSEIENKITVSPFPEWVLDSDINKDGDSLSDYMHLEKQIHICLKTHFYRAVRKFNSINSIQHGSIFELDIDINDEMLALHRFKIYRKNEEIDKLIGMNKKLIKKERHADNFIYSGIWTLILILDDIREGDILEYAYSYIRGEDFITAESFQDSLYFNTSVDTKRSYFRLLAPIKRTNLKFHGKNEPKSVQDLDHDLREWIWDNSSVKSAIFEPDQPSWYNPFNWLQISSFNNWNEVAECGSRIFPNDSELSPIIHDVIVKWKREHADMKNLILAIIRFVQQEIRYLSLEDNRLEKNCAVDPKEVYVKRFGDCKDKTLLLSLLLKEIGIQSYPALVNTSLKEKITSFLPSFQFNHAILAVEYEGAFYWIDPTLSYQRGTFNSVSRKKYAYALLIGHPEKALVEMDCTESESKTITITKFNLKELDEPVEMEIETRYINEMADNIRQYLSQITLEDLAKNYLNYTSQFYPDIASNKFLEVEDLTDENIVVIKESYSIPHLAVKKTNGLQVEYTYKFIPLSILSCLNCHFNPNRETPLSITCPLNIEEEIIIKTSQEIEFPNDDININNSHYKYKESWIKDKENLYRVSFSLISLKDHVDVEHLHNIKEFMNNLGDRIVIIMITTKNLAERVESISSKMSIGRIIYIGFIIFYITHLFTKLIRTLLP